MIAFLRITDEISALSGNVFESDGFVMIAIIHIRIGSNREFGLYLYGFLWTIIDAGEARIAFDIIFPGRFFVNHAYFFT
jgi:hypothetical protein